MTKRYIGLILTLLTYVTLAIGQNLVPNPSFELYSQCPSSLSTPTDDQVTRANGWSSFHDTPDFYHVCATSPPVKVPLNNAGYQFPHSGNAYCGGVTYNKNGLFREIIGRQLSSTLTIGQKYFVSFYTCLSGKPGFTFATNKIGAKFTTTQYNYNSNPIPINNAAQIHFDTLITDTTTWKLISGSFVADSSYQYIALGNFFDDLNTDTFCINNASLTLDGYYYIDDVCVSTDSLFSVTWTGIKEYKGLANYKLFPNPMNQCSVLQFENSKNETCTLTIYNSQGQITLTFKNITSDKVEIERKYLTSGLYYFQLRTAKQILATGKLEVE